MDTRLYPSVPFDLKQCQSTRQLPNGTVVEAGKYVVYLPYAIGRSTAVWGPDAAEFRPERWLDDARRPSQFEYPVFNVGTKEAMDMVVVYVC